MESKNSIFVALIFIYCFLLNQTVFASVIAQQTTKDTNISYLGNPRQDFNIGALSGELKTVTLSLEELPSSRQNEFRLGVVCFQDLVNFSFCPEQWGLFLFSNLQSVKGPQKDYVFTFPGGYVFNSSRAYVIQISGSATSWGAFIYGSVSDVYFNSLAKNLVLYNGNRSPYSDIGDLYFIIKRSGDRTTD